jgi:hypothetical protein
MFHKARAAEREQTMIVTMTDKGWDGIHLREGSRFSAASLAHVTFYLWQREDKTLGVEAWPFEEDEFSVNVEMHQLKQLRFENEADLRKALKETSVEFRSWTFKK